MIPGLIMATAMAVEVASWTSAQLSVQRAADVSAIAGGINYLLSNNAQTATTFAARMAQLNGGSGATNTTWNSTTNTLTDNQVTAQLVTGYKSSTDTALKVTVQKTVPATVSKAFSSTGNYTVTGTGVVEMISTTTPPTGAGADQPCILTLSTSGAITGTSGDWITMPNCSMRSNGTISFNGGGSIDAKALFAGGAISIQAGISVTGTEYPSDGTITDPFASNTALQSALTTAAGLSGKPAMACYSAATPCTGLSYGSSCSGSYGAVTCTLYPGDYSTWATESGGPFTFNLQPGLYLFSGAITFSQTTTVTGSGVTIIAAGGIGGTSQFTFTATAPTATEAAAASPNSITGIVLASQSSSQTSFSGETTFNPSGVVYLPNSALVFSGSGSSSSAPSTGSTAGSYCLEIVAKTLQVAGYTNFDASSCSTTYGSATSFYSMPGVTTKTAQVVH